MASNLKRPLELIKWRGAVVLVGGHIDAAVERLAPDADAVAPFHITVLTKDECRSLDGTSLPDLDLSHVYILGPSSYKAEIRWLVVVWNHGNIYRKSLGLPRKDFHITISRQDNHEVDKGLSSINGGETRLHEVFSSLDEVAMDHILASKHASMQTTLAVEMVRQYPESHKAHIRLADATIDSEPKTSMLAYAQALRLDSGLSDYVSRRMLRISANAAWGPVVTAKEFAVIQAHGLEAALVRPWAADVMKLCNDHLWPTETPSREPRTYLGTRLPRFFSWLYPHRLAGMSTPCSEADIDVLLDMGVTTVLTLTKEEPLDPRWFQFKRIRNIYIPLVNYGNPTLAEMDLIFDQFSQDAEGRWLVHCGGGKGRAGTVLACLMAMLGYRDDEQIYGTPKLDKTTAIREIRSIRPGSIESDRQEDFVGDWISHRWAVQSRMVDCSEPVTELESEIEPKAFTSALNHENVQYCFLVGLPGSGKTWIAQAIAKRRSLPTIIISQDESGSRRSCENAIAQQRKSGTLVILDCCNTSVRTRKEWSSLISSIDPSIIAVHLDVPREVCEARINIRYDHPVIRAGAGSNALDQMSGRFEPPRLTEGFGAVLRVTSFYAARQAALLLGGPAVITKFPRTPHVIDLGATTPDDIVHDMQEMHGKLVVEEKVDGANMGISLDWEGEVVVQNRSHYVSPAEHAQFKPLGSWVPRHSPALKRILGSDPHYPERYILFGEWVVARHSIHYTRLPGQFVAFDLYDRVTKTFVSRRVLASALRGSGIEQVPLLAETTHLTREELVRLAQTDSGYYDGRVEGVYIRTEDDAGMHTVSRGKVVRNDFLSGNEHWSKGKFVLNGIQDEQSA